MKILLLCVGIGAAVAMVWIMPTIPGVGTALAGLFGAVGMWLRSRRVSKYRADLDAASKAASRATAQIIESMSPEQRANLSRAASNVGM